MTAQTFPSPPEAVSAISALQHRANVLNGMADAADILFEEMPGMRVCRWSNGMTVLLLALSEQSKSLADDLAKLECVLRAAAKGGAA